MYISTLQKLMNDKCILGWDLLLDDLRITFNNGAIIKLKIDSVEVIREEFPK